MRRILILFALLILLLNCTKKQLEQITITMSDPIEQQTYHKNDTVFILGTISYEKKIKNIGFFVALVNKANDSTFYQRTFLPVVNPHHIQEYYINEFNDGADVTLSYGKRHIKTGQIYEIKEINLKFIP